MRVLRLALLIGVPLAAAHAAGDSPGLPALSPRLPQPSGAAGAQPPVLVPACHAPDDWERQVKGDMQAMQDYARCLRDALETVKNELRRRGLS